MKKLAPYVLLAPAVVSSLMMAVLPVVNVGRLSLFQSDYLTEKWVGLRNYKVIFSDQAFLSSLVNSMVYAGAFAMGGVVIALVLTLYSYDLPKRWKNGLRMAAYLPTIAAGIIISQVWLWVFHPSGGLANWLLSLFHLAPVRWFSARGTALAVVFIAISLSIPGTGYILFMGAASSISVEVLDAARVDGASRNQVRWWIVTPSIMWIVLLQCLFSLLGGLQVWEFVYALTNGGPARSTESMMYYVYAAGLLRGQYGIASAGSVVLLSIGLLGAALIKRIKGA